jgi:DnaK suppressor protein
MGKRRDINMTTLRQALNKRRVEVMGDDQATEEDRAPVELDESSVGRLSRMDAMQVHAMAEATHERRQAEIHRIDAALARMDAGDYGYCLSCDEKIPAKRLELDPAVPTCVACAARAEDAHADHVHSAD